MGGVEGLLVNSIDEYARAFENGRRHERKIASESVAELVEACKAALPELCGWNRPLGPNDTEYREWGCCDASRAAFKIKKALAKHAT